jgi:4-hydroxythreonine-4-phosphate dehydrogenase
MSAPLVRPLLLTMGDPSGIGPEIVVAAARLRPELRRQLLVVGDRLTLQRAMDIPRADGLSHGAPMRLVEVADIADWQADDAQTLQVLQTGALDHPAPWGRQSAASGRAAAQCIERAARETLQGRACGIVTAPVNKEALSTSGLPHPGHTEFLQALSAEFLGLPVERVPVRMMLSTPGLATVLVSIHVSLREAIEAVRLPKVLETIRITAAHFQRCGLPHPRIAVAGLNPHAGEGGLFGREEIEHIGPAIAQACREGLDASGPHAPDTVFMRARRGEFDAVVAMYHDQGLIPVKLMGIESGVNTTLGLPLIRTSPDHGTAFDLAGSGRASPDSLLAALDAALAMSGAHPGG